MPTGVYIRKKGLKRKSPSDETLKKMSERMKKNPLNYWLGKKRSLEDRKKMSEAKKKSGHKPPSRKGTKLTEEHKRKIGKASKGRVHSLESLIRGAKKRRGTNHWNWKGGTSNSEDKKIRRTAEYRLWREAVFERDDYTCIWCSEKGGVLNADHIKRFSEYPELRFAIDNGRTLCVPCHKTTNNYGTKGYKKNK